MLTTMGSDKRKVAVLGAGSWGTALAHQLHVAGNTVVLWGRDKEVLRSIKESGRSEKFFPGEKIGPGIDTTDSLKEAVSGARIVVFAVPSVALKEVAKACEKHVEEDAIYVSSVKGLEERSSRTMTEVIADILGAKDRVATLSGPSIAVEVIRGQPTAVTVAAHEAKIASAVSDAFHSSTFRVYTSSDVVGVELGGAVKNVIALATGVVDGAGMGSNARAALITRGLAEMQRLIVARGGDRLTAVGLSGMGDLLLTATSDLSRNRRVGIALGQGKKLPEILAQIGQVAEGVETARKVVKLAKKLKVPMPICDEAKRLIDGESSVEESIQALLSRAQTKEFV